MFSIPNLLTYMRVLLIPVFVVVFYLPYQWTAMASALIFFVAGFTDWLDGYLARKLNQSSKFGAFLDPVADKVMVGVALILITEQHASIWISIPALTMISREIIISALREWMAEVGKRSNAAVSNVGKYKTASQMLAIMLLLANYNEYSQWAGYICLYIATTLTYWSMFIYLRAAKDDLLAEG